MTIGLQGVSALSLDWATLRSLTDLTDEVGVLSVYTSLDPQQRTGPKSKPAWEVRVRQQLAQVRERLKQDGPRDHWKALEARLESLRPSLDQLLDPAGSGQGRALFATVSDGQVRTVTLQVPLIDRVVLEPRAHLRPLISAWNAAGPAGAVAVGAEGVRAVDIRFGLAENVGVFPYQGSIEQRELKGPAGANPALAQHSAPQRDLFERREDDKLIRFLRPLGPRLADLAKEREWSFLVVTGEASLVQAVTEGLSARSTLEVIELEHPVNSLSPPKLAALVTPALADARQRRGLALAQRARDGAFGGDAGAYGLSDTLVALQQGQVAHLLLAADGQWRGSSTPDGILVPQGEVPPGADPSALTAEQDLAERMIELAFRDSAEVTLLDPTAAAPLADAGGVGAVLRW